MAESNDSYQRPTVSPIGSVADLTLGINKNGLSTDAYSTAIITGSIITTAKKP